MPLKPLSPIPVWQRVVGAVVGLGLIYYLYRGGSGSLAGTVITICVAFFARSLFRSGAIPSNTLIPENSSIRPRSIARDGAIAVGCWVVAMLWVIPGAMLVKRQAIPDNYLTASLIVGPALVLICAGGFFIFRTFTGIMFGRRQ
jgi:hypothetical protein